MRVTVTNSSHKLSELLSEQQLEVVSVSQGSSTKVRLTLQNASPTAKLYLELGAPAAADGSLEIPSGEFFEITEDNLALINLVSSEASAPINLLAT